VLRRAAILATDGNRDKLDRVADDLPGIHTFRNDVGRPEERLRLAENVESHFPNLNIVLAVFCELPSGIYLPLRNFENRGRARFSYFLEIICFTEFLRFHCRNQVPGRYPKSSAATVPVADETASGEDANVPDTAAQGEDLTSQPEHVSHLRQSSGR
jgi:hypothetical protein